MHCCVKPVVGSFGHTGPGKILAPTLLVFVTVCLEIAPDLLDLSFSLAICLVVIHR